MIPTIAIKISCPKPSRKHLWGDFHFAEALAASFDKIGFNSRIDLLPYWYTAREDGDINFALQGSAQFEPIEGMSNYCWIISHPKKAQVDHLAKFDHLFVASVPFARELRRKHGLNAEPLLQCTDPSRFNPVVSAPKAKHHILFVGNTRGRYRSSVKFALEAGLDISVFGFGWQHYEQSESWHRGLNVKNSRLAGYYRTAGVVLNDHWRDMRMLGFVSNRVFDVVASGGLLLTDDVKGLPEGLSHCVKIYRDSKSMSDAISEYARVGNKDITTRLEFACEFGQQNSFCARVKQLCRSLSQDNPVIRSVLEDECVINERR